MPSCTVSYCKNFNTNTKETDIKYFSFPKYEDMAKQWITACKRSVKVNLKNGKDPILTTFYCILYQNIFQLVSVRFILPPTVLKYHLSRGCCNIPRRTVGT